MDKDKTGFINADELAEGIKNSNLEISTEDIHKIISEIDEHENNKINYSIGQLEALKIFIKNKYIIKKEKKFSLLINFYRFIFINNLFFNYKINSSVNVKNNIKFFAFLIGFILFIKDVLSFNIKNEKFIKNIDQPTKIS